jgi:hypothetical protein
MSEKTFGAAPDPIRDALHAAALADCDAEASGHVCVCLRDGVMSASCVEPAAAAVAAFLRALPATISIQTGSGHLRANMSGFAELATEVERAARKGNG